MTFDEMNPLQRRLHNAALVLEAEGGDHGFAKLQRDAIDGIAALTKDADRWRWWCDAVSNQDMCLLEQVFAPIPHDKPTDKKALDAVVDAAIAAQKEQIK